MLFLQIQLFKKGLDSFYFTRQSFCFWVFPYSPVYAVLQLWLPTIWNYSVFSFPPQSEDCHSLAMYPSKYDGDGERLLISDISVLTKVQVPRPVPRSTLDAVDLGVCLIVSIPGGSFARKDWDCLPDRKQIGMVLPSSNVHMNHLESFENVGSWLHKVWVGSEILQF